LIDLHGGDLDESLRPFGYWFRTGDAKLDQASREMLVAFGLDHNLIFDDFPKDPAASRYLDSTALLKGKPAIAVEAGYAGTVEPEDVEVLVRGCFSVMRHLGMLAGEKTPVENPVWFEKPVTVQSDRSGVFYPRVRRGTFVEAGMRLGHVTDYFGKTVDEPRAPTAGVVLYVRAVPSLKKGDTIADIGVLAPKAP
jgi:predicted deacylase